MNEAYGSTELRIDYVPFGKNGSATLTARLGDDILSHSKVDLGKPKARTEFAESIAKGRPGIDANAIEKELLRIGADLVHRHVDCDDDHPAVPTAADLLAKTPDHVRAEARAMLESPDLLGRCYRDVAALGVAGEGDLVAAVYLTGVSRLLRKPLAAIVQAPSSVGKSYTVGKVAELFPPEEMIHATAMTAQSLYYLEPGALRHKWIVAGERSRREDDDTAEATRALREMISSGRLAKLVPMKQEGKIVTQRIEQDGPIAFVETTTQSRIFDEDANRCLLLTADERPQQTRMIVDRIAATYAGATDVDTKPIIERHHAAQRMLEPWPVSIPFAGKIAEQFDCERVEARRAIGHVMGMIQACAMLHQFQRTIDGAGRIVATVADYEMARHLCRGPLARLLGGRTSDAAIRFHQRLQSWVVDRFTTTEAAKRDRKASQTVRDWLRALCEAGGVEQIEASKGSRPATWKLLEINHDELAAGESGLPEKID